MAQGQGHPGDGRGGADAGEPSVADTYGSDEQRVDRWWDLTGSIESSGSVNFLSHRSATGTPYTGLQRLRNRLNLQLDLKLPKGADEGDRAWLSAFDDWQLRFAGWGYYDLAYLLNGRHRYTSDVRRTYERDAETGDMWLRGALGDIADFKVGRQIVVWGRSETLRVVDVLNPLDNLEPGRVDLEDLRRPVGMLRLDAYAGDWTFSPLVIPEIRFDRNPVVGSDFYPGTVEPRERRPADFEDLELAAAITGIFSGWDVSFHAAWFWNDEPRFRRDAEPTVLVHDRLWMLGSAGNYTAGSWLWKVELAYLDGLQFFNGDGGHKGRLDGMAGVEYYGITDLTIVVEGLNRHLFDYETALRDAPDWRREDAQELAVRATRNFLHETLHATALAVLLGWDGGGGSLARFDIEYDLRDALRLGAGILLYQHGDVPPFDAWGRNDRLLFSLKWSF
ncbi:MAG: DUF1302 family protein [Candidatus Binatia bacterium]